METEDHQLIVYADCPWDCPSTTSLSEKRPEQASPSKKLQPIRAIMIGIAVILVAQLRHGYNSLPLSSRVLEGGFIKERKPSLHLIGERHSGTNWMTRELKRCFPDAGLKTRLSRWKHWFQANGTNYATKDAVVVVQVRNVYDWVEAMRSKPYHSPDHFDLDWRTFLSKPWTMAEPDLPPDNTTECQNYFSRNAVVPCIRRQYQISRSRNIGALYEMSPDGTPYPSLLELRRDKMMNFLSVESFVNVSSYALVRYEDMVEQGTESLIRRLEAALGTTAQCDPTPGRPLERSRPLDPAMVEWMNHHVDWEVERKIGYSPVDWAGGGMHGLGDGWAVDSSS